MDGCVDWDGANKLKKFFRERAEELLEVGDWQSVVATNNHGWALILGWVLVVEGSRDRTLELMGRVKFEVACSKFLLHRLFVYGSSREAARASARVGGRILHDGF